MRSRRSPARGPLRPGRLAKLLPDFGWTPTTITGPWRGAHADLGEVIPITPIGDPFVERMRGIRRIATSPTRWFAPALRKTLELTAERRFDAVISVSNPGFDHMIAATVAHRSGIPWIADYSEAWTGNLFARKTPLVRRWDAFVETTSIREAAAITCATPGIRNMVAKLNGRTDIGRDRKTPSIFRNGSAFPTGSRSRSRFSTRACCGAERLRPNYSSPPSRSCAVPATPRVPRRASNSIPTSIAW